MIDQLQHVVRKVLQNLPPLENHFLKYFSHLTAPSKNHFFNYFSHLIATIIEQLPHLVHKGVISFCTQCLIADLGLL